MLNAGITPNHICFCSSLHVKKKSSRVYLSVYSCCCFWGIPVSLLASWKPLQHASPARPGSALGCSLSQPWLGIHSKGCTQGVCILTRCQTTSSGSLECSGAGLTQRPTGTVWLLTVSQILRLVTTWIKLPLAAWIHNHILLVTTKSFWPKVSGKIYKTDLYAK